MDAVLHQVELDTTLRSDEALAARFDSFARVECAPIASGESSNSPAYATLSRHVAGSGVLLALARECRAGQPIPNLFFAAIKRLLADEPREALAGIYRQVARGGKPPPALPREFGRYCRRRSDAIVEIVRTRNVQTNEVSRCSSLMPAFGVVALDAGRDLALIDVGASAGLNLLWDRFDYRYSDGSSFGSGRSPVRIDCECRGTMPQIPAHFPKVAYRVGIDLSPVDLGQDEAYRWLQALIWPEHADRMARLAAARSVWLQQPPRVEAGDALVLLPEIIEKAPKSAALCIVHSHTLNQFSERARAAFARLLQSVSKARPVYEVSAEHDRLTLFRYAAREGTLLLSAARSAHGRWVDW